MTSTERNVVHFRGQVYEDIKKTLLASGTLFRDPEFPPESWSISYGNRYLTDEIAVKDIIWARPEQIMPGAQIFVDGVSRDDIRQGALGNCWFVGACSVLTNTQELWKKVIPDPAEQACKGRYCGIYKFCFWRFGRWIEVVVDDFLPTFNGELVFAKSRSKREFWSALLEKAFAKVHGCYKALTAGSSVEGFVDITGGIAERIDITQETRTSGSTRDLFRKLQECFNDKALISAFIVVSHYLDLLC